MQLIRRKAIDCFFCTSGKMIQKKVFNKKETAWICANCKNKIFFKEIEDDNKRRTA